MPLCPTAWIDLPRGQRQDLHNPGAWLGSLRSQLSRLRDAVVRSLSIRTAQPWPSLVFRTGTFPEGRRLTLWQEESLRFSDVEAISPVHLLLGSTLPDPGFERPNVWGRRLAGCLLLPAGRLPALPGVDERRLDLLLGELLAYGEIHADGPAWVAKATRACVVHWARERRRGWAVAEETLHWQAEDRCGFLLNRLLSYPEIQAARHRKGLKALGGFVPAMCLAWETLYCRLVSQPTDVRLPVALAQPAPAVSWSQLLAGLVLRRGRVDRCRRIDPAELCHEIAHHVLHHDLETDRSEEQELAADALASLWLHLFQGLTEIGLALGRTDSAVVAIFPSREDGARAG